jgi:hypothetical protein
MVNSEKGKLVQAHLVIHKFVLLILKLFPLIPTLFRTYFQIAHNYCE